MLFLRYYTIKFIMVQKCVGKSNLQKILKLSCVNKIILELFLLPRSKASQRKQNFNMPKFCTCQKKKKIYIYIYIIECTCQY